MSTGIDNRHVIPGLVRARMLRDAMRDAIDKCGMADDKMDLLRAIREGIAASEEATEAFRQAHAEVLKRR